ncbi:cytochrome b/b6 domain-containing protein [Candidatus Halobeggiatoa sp. HSG11]|nr:cytochrome b/b6 domain-containing protein [Candidatus Halobeggiatoa sp. HSG11]
MAKVIMYKGFERLWHWLQAGLMIFMLITGFEIHGTINWLGFETAIDVHIILAWSLIGLWTFAIFWHLVTGEWKQYIPSSFEHILAMVRYYTIDIFLGNKHPFQKTTLKKHNPLQRMAYLSLHLFISPTIWISGGFLYLFYTLREFLGLELISFGTVALIHTAAAFALLTFLIAHLYLAITTSKKPFGYVKAMITGYEDEE